MPSPSGFRADAKLALAAQNGRDKKLTTIWIKNSQENQNNDIQAVMQAVPNMWNLVKFFWQKNSNLAWWKRIKLFYYDLGGYFNSEKS